MRTGLPLLALFYVLVCASCSHEHGHEHHDTTGESCHADVKLNNGKKWPTDSITRTSFQKARLAVDDYFKQWQQVASQPKQLKNVQANVALVLDGIWKKLMAQCTMKGKAHDQLHILLAPILKSTANIDAKGHDQLVNLRNLIGQFFEYFES